MFGEHQIAYEKHILPLYKKWEEVELAIAESGLDPLLKHLVKLRASQINGCAFCVKMHIAEARRDGETSERLDRLVVWRHVGDYTDAEKAALAWTEALTLLEKTTDYSKLRHRLLQHYSEADISQLTAAIMMINLWNRFAVSRH